MTFPALRFVAAALVALAPLACAQVYVSPQGSDSRSGSRQHPLRTLRHAIDVSRASGVSRIVVAGGVYRLTSPLRVGPGDSGTPAQPLVIAAAPGEHPVISGALRVGPWREVDPATDLWAATVPDDVVNSRQLYVNGVRAFRTRGRVPVDLTETPTGYIASAATMSSWKNPSDIEFVYTGGNSIWSEKSEGLGAWTEPRCPIASIEGTTITMAQPCWDNSTKRAMLPNGERTANLVGPRSVGQRPEYVENAYELLGTPGQWYFDRPAHTLYYVPRRHENLRTADVEMPVLTRLIEAEGSTSGPVHDIVFRGIQFSYATWLGPGSPEGFSEIQANYLVTGRDGYARQGLCHLVPDGVCPYGDWTPAPANVSFRFAHNIQFVDDDFIHLGAAGLSLGDGAQDNLVEGCIFTDISGNGLDLGGVDEPLAPSAARTSGNRIEDNLFRNVGAEYRGGIPIVVGYASNTVIAHNEIDHIPYAAISMGWGGWPDKIRQAGEANDSQGNVIRDNRIHDLMLVLADGGGIYTQGLTGPDLAGGERVEGNLVYDQFSSGHAIYTDNGSSMITVRGNVMFHTNMDNWGSRHHDYYNEQDGSDFDPLAIEDNYWQQGDPDSSRQNVTEAGNHLIDALSQVPASVLHSAGLDAPSSTSLEQRYTALVRPRAPRPPSRVAAAPGNGFAEVTFNPPVDDGNAPVTSYTVTASTGAQATISAADFARMAYLHVSGLPNDRPVTFTVTAANAAGVSESSLPSLPITPSANAMQPPPPPAHVSAEPGEDGRVSIHFQAPADEQKESDAGAITSYVVLIHPGDRKVTFTGRAVLTLPGTRHTTFQVISGLAPGTYTFSVSAVNDAGAGHPGETQPVTIR